MAMFIPSARWSASFAARSKVASLAAARPWQDGQSPGPCSLDPEQFRSHHDSLSTGSSSPYGRPGMGHGKCPTLSERSKVRLARVLELGIMNPLSDELVAIFHL